MSTTARDLSRFVFPLDPKAFKLRQLSGIILPQYLDLLARDARLEKPFQVAITLQLETDRWHVTGTIDGEMVLLCSRCLDPFSHATTVDVQRDYVAGPDKASRLPELEVIEDVVYLEDGQFSVRRLVEEELIIALPMIPLCRPDCAGLCPGCGAELNRELCHCQAKESNSPFAILKGRL